MSRPFQPSPRAAANPDTVVQFGPSIAQRTSPEIYSGMVRVAETSLVVATAYAIAAFYVAETDFNASWQYLTAPMIAAVIMLGVFQALGLYRIAALSTLSQQLIRLSAGWFATVASFIAVVFFLKAGQEFSRVWLASWAVLGFATILGIRLHVQSITKRAIAEGRLSRRAVIYGGGQPCADVLAQLAADPSSDAVVCGIFDDRDIARAGIEGSDVQQLGGIQDLVTYCRQAAIDMIIVALPLSAEQRINELKRHFNVLPADIRIAAGASQLRLSPRAYSYIGNVPMIDLTDKPISGWGTIAKNCFDKTIAGIALVLLSPVLLAVAAAIRWDSKGAIFFKQKRYGFNNELIEVWKFRSMYVDKADATASKLVTKDDPRVTRVGRVIRKTSLDELPQLFNVLGGTLSLVGPRPHAVQAKAADKLYPEVVDDYFMRHKVKPGITGWAQINGWRGETDTPEKIQKRVEHDIYYIENWSILLDAYILIKTPMSLLKTENAY